MLVISRKLNERVQCSFTRQTLLELLDVTPDGETVDITICVTKIQGGQVRLGICAPRNVQLFRPSEVSEHVR